MHHLVKKSRLLLTAAILSAGMILSAGAEDESAPTGEESESSESSAAAPKQAIPTPFPGTVLTDPRGKPDLTVCSQNLKLLGSYEEMKKKNIKYTQKAHADKISALSTRFLKAKCDVIALQEVMGTSASEEEAALQPIIEQLRVRGNREFEAKVGLPGDGGMALGFLVAKDRSAVINVLSYSRVELPKLVTKGRPRFFSRTPFEVQLSVRSRHDDTAKIVSLVNFHLKSKRGGEGDPTGLEWETFRMEMAEGFRRIIEVRHQKAFASNEQILMVLGDRNSNFDVASAKILDGSLTIENFRTDGGCRVSKRGFPVCTPGKQMPQRLFSILTSNQEVATYQGTFSYKGEYSWIDDMLMPAESLQYAWLTPTSEGRYDAGLISEPADASDHALLWARLNW